MRRIVQILLVSSCVMGTGSIVQAADIGVSIDGKRGIDADVGVSLGGGKGINADVDAAVGGNDGVNANVDASIGGGDGVKADVNASVGSQPGVDADLSLGLKADDVSGDANDDDSAMSNNGISPASPDGVLTSGQRQALNGMSESERKSLIRRCGSISAASYDPALVNLCKLLRMSASR